MSKGLSEPRPHVDEASPVAHAVARFDSLTRRRPLDPQARAKALTLLEGHPLAIGWVGGLLAHCECEPTQVIEEWAASGLPALSDPLESERTLRWIFDRSVRGLGDPARQVLAAAGLLANTPFPIGAIVAATDDAHSSRAAVRRTRLALEALAQRGIVREAAAGGWEFTHPLGHRFAGSLDGAGREMQSRLARWLGDSIEDELERSRDGDALPAVGTLLEHVAALMLADDPVFPNTGLPYLLLNTICPRLEQLGRLDLMTIGLDAVAKRLAQLDPVVRESSFWRRQQGTMVKLQGRALSAKGDLAAVLELYRESVAESRRLSDDAPWRRRFKTDLADGQVDVGDVLAAQGDLDGALAAYAESVALTRSEVEEAPSNLGAQQTLGVRLAKVGDVLLAQGDLNGALAAHREAGAVIRRWVNADPPTVDLQRDLIVVEQKLGDAALAHDDVERARAAIRESAALVQRAAAAERPSVDALCDISARKRHVGDLLLARGDVDRALAAYRTSVEVLRPYAEADPGSKLLRREFSLSQAKLGDALLALRDVAGALAAYRESLAVIRPAAAADPADLTLQRDLSLAQERVGDALLTQRDFAGALTCYSESLAVIRRLAEADPSNVDLMLDISLVQTKLGDVLAACGDLAGALTCDGESLASCRRQAEGES